MAFERVPSKLRENPLLYHLLKNIAALFFAFWSKFKFYNRSRITICLIGFFSEFNRLSHFKIAFPLLQFVINLSKGGSRPISNF